MFTPGVTSPAPGSDRRGGRRRAGPGPPPGGIGPCSRRRPSAPAPRRYGRRGSDGRARRPRSRLPADGRVALEAALAIGAADREAVVLRGDLDPAGGELLDGVVGSAVSEGELERLEANGAAEELVAEAD